MLRALILFASLAVVLTAVAAFAYNEVIVWGVALTDKTQVWGTSETTPDPILWGVPLVVPTSNCTFNDGTFGTDCTF